MGPDWQKLNPHLASLGVEANLVADNAFLDGAAPGKRVLIAERDPHRFLAHFFVALSRECSVFLVNPDWSLERCKRALQIVQPHFVIGSLPVEVDDMSHTLLLERGHYPAIMIPTGGSTGKLLFATHTWETLTAAARSFQKFFGAGQLDNCCALPLFHVSGLMQVIRTLINGGKLVFVNLTAIREDCFSLFAPESFHLSLVPTQLKRLLSGNATRAWLSRFKQILLGGAAAEKELLEAAREARLRLAPCYGMTETAALVTVLKPADFLADKKGVGYALPHAEIFIRDEAGFPLPPRKRGRIIIQADSLFHGYYPVWTDSYPGGYTTHDEGFFDEEGSLHITGRCDRIINTGGEKVDPCEVERALYETKLVRDVVVVSTPDPEWGEGVMALVVLSEPEVSLRQLQTALRPRLAPYQIPKKWIPVASIPRNVMGKLNLNNIQPL